MITPDPLHALLTHTQARLALGRAGAAMPTNAVLDLAFAHASARDAVHLPLDTAALAAEIASLGLASVQVHSQAPDRQTYLRRPDLGRLLAPESAAMLARSDPPSDLAIVAADGLSAAAIHAQALPFLREFLPHCAQAGWRLAPIVIATQARVALGDAIAASLGATAVAILIGERPGLSSPDSLGVYLTLAPRPCITNDGERNCISNIRPAGLKHAEAAFKLAWLLAEARKRGATGVALKDESDVALLAGGAARAIG
jgi:ethanolamine ammonia-lyase small subunit